MGSDSKGMGNEDEVIQIYTIVEAKSINELVKLTNLKTKAGWICIGGMCYTPNNVCEADQHTYPYCQSMYRMEKPKKQMPAKKFEAFPYDGKSKSFTKPKMDGRYKRYYKKDKKKDEKK